MTRHSIAATAVSIALCLPMAALAQIAPDPAFRAVTLDPVNHRDATLTVVDPQGDEHSYGPADLEALPTYALETTTPWRETPARFEGILLVDLLQRHNLDTVDRLLVLAENDYVSEIERAAWTTGAILIATRVDGRPHGRRARGPIQFVVPAATFEAEPAITTQHLVWMAAAIRPAD